MPNPAATKALLESFGVTRAWCTSFEYVGDIEWLIQGLFGDVLASSIRSNFGITNILRLRVEVMSIKICILRAFTKQGAAHECGNNSKTLGGSRKIRGDLF